MTGVFRVKRYKSVMYKCVLWITIRHADMQQVRDHNHDNENIGETMNNAHKRKTQRFYWNNN